MLTDFCSALQISLSVSSGRPVKLVPVQDPGTPTVSNAMSASSRTLIRCLQLQLRVCSHSLTSLLLFLWTLQYFCLHTDTYCCHFRDGLTAVVHRRSYTRKCDWSSSNFAPLLTRFSNTNTNRDPNPSSNLNPN